MATGDLSIPYIPEPDFVAVEKIFNVRKVLKGRPLPLPSNVIDGGRREEMDNFYLVSKPFHVERITRKSAVDSFLSDAESRL